MERNHQRILFVVIPIVIIFVGLIGVKSYFLGEKVITSGGGYGFEIGDTREIAYGKSVSLLNNEEIVEIHNWPKNEFHRKIENTEELSENKDPRWVLVVDAEWWNNTILLEFENDRINRIARYRICCELP